MDLACLSRKLDDFKLFRDVEKQATRQVLRRQLQDHTNPTEGSIDI